MTDQCYDTDYELSDLHPDDCYLPVCRFCGLELTNSSELLDDTCTFCFQKRRESR